MLFLRSNELKWILMRYPRGTRTFHEQYTDWFEGNVVGLEILVVGLLLVSHSELLGVAGVQP